MSTTYVKSQIYAQKKDASSAASVLDSSSQSESLQRKADMANNAAQRAEAPRPNNTGMPDNLKAGIESLSGFSMDDVRVHYNSSKPATVQALAYTQGTDIHVAPGQEKHLPHEAWHVAQQMAGRVSPTTNINGMPVNDNAGLEHEADVMGEKAVQCNLEEKKKSSFEDISLNTQFKTIQKHSLLQRLKKSTGGAIRSLSDFNAHFSASLKPDVLATRFEIPEFFIDYLIQNCNETIYPAHNLETTLDILKDGVPSIFNIIIDKDFADNKELLSFLYKSYHSFTGENSNWDGASLGQKNSFIEFLRQVLQEKKVTCLPEKHAGYFLTLLSEKYLFLQNNYASLMAATPNRMVYFLDSKGEGETLRKQLLPEFCIYRSCTLNKGFGITFGGDAHGGCLEEAMSYYTRDYRNRMYKDKPFLIEIRMENITPQNILNDLGKKGEGTKSNPSKLGRKTEEKCAFFKNGSVFSVHLGDGANEFFKMCGGYFGHSRNERVFVSVIAFEPSPSEEFNRQIRNFKNKSIDEYTSLTTTLRQSLKDEFPG